MITFTLHMQKLFKQYKYVLFCSLYGIILTYSLKISNKCVSLFATRLGNYSTTEPLFGNHE